jgi:hypothetical protein
MKAIYLTKDPFHARIADIDEAQLPRATCS